MPGRVSFSAFDLMALYGSGNDGIQIALLDGFYEIAVMLYPVSALYCR